jgi:hypothetical protein
MHMENKQVMIVQAEEEDHAQIMDIIVTSFIKFDPLVNYLSLTVADFTACVAPYVRASMQQKLTFIARDMNDSTVAGVCVAHDVTTEIIFAEGPYSSGISNYVDFFTQLSSPLAGLSPEMPGTILCGGFLGVASKYYGANIPAMINASLLIAARAKGYKKVVSEFTNPSNYYSYKRMSGDKLKNLNVLPFKDFINRKFERPMSAAHGEAILTIIDI